RVDTQMRVAAINATLSRTVDRLILPPSMRRSLRAPAPGRDPPPAGARMLEQEGVGVDRNRMGDRRQKRQIVVRIAVEPRFGEVAEVAVHGAQPVLDPRKLA